MSVLLKMSNTCITETTEKTENPTIVQESDSVTASSI